MKVVRSDGLTLGFTDHDLPIEVGGLAYQPADAGQLSAIEQNVGVGVDNLEAEVLLAAGRVAEADVLAGLYHAAKVEIRLANWADPSMGAALLFTGWIAEASLSDGTARFGLRSLASALRQERGDLVQPQCRVARLGDAQCGVNLATFTFSATVLSVADTFHLVASDSQVSGVFDQGTLGLTSGANAGLRREIKTHTLSGGHASLALARKFPWPVSAGDSCLLVAGCDRRLATCRDKFANVLNFRGEPYLPGTSVITRTGRPAG